MDYQAQEIPFDQIYINSVKENCRAEIQPGEVQSLAEDIKTRGIIQLPLVSPTPKGEGYPEEFPYVLVAGYRRAHAMRDLLGWEKLPCNVRPLHRAEIIALNFKENDERVNLNMLQEAIPVQRYKRMGKKRDEIARLLGKSEGWVQIRDMALSFPQAVKDQIALGLIPTENIRELYSYKDNPDTQIKLAKYIVEQREKGVQKIRLTRPAQMLSVKPGKMNRVRDKVDVENLLMHLMDVSFPFGLHTRVMAWMLGNISDNDLMQDLQDYGKEHNHFYPVSANGFPNMKDPLRGELRRS